MAKPTHLFDRRIVWTVAAALTVALGGGPAVADEVAIEEHRLPGRIVWETEGSHAGGTFRLVGAEGELIRRMIGPGEALVQPLLGPDGEALPDGPASYELRLRRPAGEPGAEPIRITGQLEMRNGAAVTGPATDETNPANGELQEGRAVVETETSALAPKKSCNGWETLYYQEAVEMCAGEECISNLHCASSTFMNGNRGDFPLQIRDFELGIEFQDASTGDTVPVRDWMIQINDRNGADEFFAVVDCGDECGWEPDFPDPSESYSTPLIIEGGAHDDTIYVSGDNVGFGTVPGEDLHLLDSTPTLVLEDSDTGKFGRIRYNVGLLAFEGNDGQNIVELSGQAPHQSIVVDADGGVSLGAGMSTSSSREVKEAFEPVDRDALLEEIAALPVSTWVYTRDRDRARHLGPVAEDFHAAFGLGQDAKHISPTDLAGVALVGVQGLQDALAETGEEAQDIRRQNRALRDRVDDLEELTDRLLKRLAALDAKDRAGERTPPISRPAGCCGSSGTGCRGRPRP